MIGIADVSLTFRRTHAPLAVLVKLLKCYYGCTGPTPGRPALRHTAQLQLQFSSPVPEPSAQYSDKVLDVRGLTK